MKPIPKKCVFHIHIFIQKHNVGSTDLILTSCAPSFNFEPTHVYEKKMLKRVEKSKLTLAKNFFQSVLILKLCQEFVLSKVSKRVVFTHCYIRFVFENVCANSCKK